MWLADHVCVILWTCLRWYSKIYEKKKTKSQRAMVKNPLYWLAELYSYCSGRLFLELIWKARRKCRIPGTEDVSVRCQEIENWEIRSVTRISGSMEKWRSNLSNSSVQIQEHSLIMLKMCRGIAFCS